MSAEVHAKMDIFILHWNRPEECSLTCQSIYEQGIPVNITVIDNGSSPDCLTRLRKKLTSNVKLIIHGSNLGWGRGLNPVLTEWLHTGTSEFCAICSHDVILEPNCLLLLHSAISNATEIGIICPEYGYRNIPKFSAIRGPHYISTTVDNQSGTVEFVNLAHGTLMVVRRSCLKEIGIYDERFFAYGDEWDISLRAIQYGWKVAMVWGAIVQNRVRETSLPALSYLIARNTLLLSSIHGTPMLAYLRLTLMIVNSAKQAIFKDRTYDIHSRYLGMLDFTRGKFGQTPRLNRLL